MQWSEKLRSIAKDLNDISYYFEALEKHPNCNTCAAKRGCPHAPKLGEFVRINCFAYVEKDHEELKKVWEDHEKAPYSNK